VLRLALQFLCPLVRAESRHLTPDCRVARPDAARAVFLASRRSGRSSMPPRDVNIASPGAPETLTGPVREADAVVARGASFTAGGSSAPSSRTRSTTD
jgi:hypothetical protein